MWVVHKGRWRNPDQTSICELGPCVDVQKGEADQLIDKIFNQAYKLQGRHLLSLLVL